jgi:nitrogen regulatory protein PII
VVNFLPKIKMEVVVIDNLVDLIVEAIQRSASTGRIGDGKVFVLEMVAAVRIRTGEPGDDALKGMENMNKNGFTDYFV